MTLAARAMGFGELDPSTQTIGRTVSAPVVAQMVLGADDLALGRPSLRWSIHGGNAHAETYSLPLRVHPSLRYARLEVWLRSSFGDTGTWTLAVSVTDGTHTVSSGYRIPLVFTGPSTPYALTGQTPNRAYLAASGIFDLYALATTLTAGSDWEFILSTTGGSALTIDLAQLTLLPRGWVDDSITGGGESTASIQQGLVIAAGDATTYVDGLQRLAATIDAARVMPNVCIALSWPDDIGLDIPRTTDHSGTPVALTKLDQGGSPRKFTTRVRRLLAASAAGEAHRWRVRYRMSGGAGTETATVRLATGASGSPYDVVLAYRNTFAWSAWQSAALATNGAGQLDTVTLAATLSASGPTLWVSGWQVQSDPT